MTEDNRPFFMKIDETAKFLGMCRSKVYQLIGAGKLQARKDGKSTLIETSTVIAYAKSLPHAKIAAPKHVETAAA
jgi:excisionase family DNA binding protein